MSLDQSPHTLLILALAFLFVVLYDCCDKQITFRGNLDLLDAGLRTQDL